MKRPHLFSFLAVKTDDALSIRASITERSNPIFLNPVEEEFRPSFPIQQYRLLRAREYMMKIVGLNQAREVVYKKVFESDSFGNLNIKIPLRDERKEIEMLEVYETKTYAGIDINLGTYLPLKIENPKKLVISDFDKTLVETRYHTTKELYLSLTSPLSDFPTIDKSVAKIREYTDQGFHPFILSASPHFYERAIRDWLYQNHIFTAGIFLKDYRQFFSFSDGMLTPKDIKHQGLYKFNHLLDILIMTGIPHELALMGDNFESDPMIYMALSRMILDDIDPWDLWNKVRRLEAFQLTNKQNSHFLNKIYQLSSLVSYFHQENPGQKPKVSIHIRTEKESDRPVLPDFLQNHLNLVSLYASPRT